MSNNPAHGAPDAVRLRCRCGSFANYASWDAMEKANTAHINDYGDGWQKINEDDAVDDIDCTIFPATCRDCYEPPERTFDDALGSVCDARERQAEAQRLKR
jgi:hypothetical protein